MRPEDLIRLLGQVKHGWHIELAARNTTGGVMLRALPPEGEQALPILLWSVD